MMSLSIEEKESLHEIVKHFNKDAVIFDVGANEGKWTEAVLEENGATSVHLFEPNEMFNEQLESLKEKYKEVQISTSNLAAYKEDNKELDFYFFTNDNNGLSSIYHNPKWDYLPMEFGKVKSITLDSYCKANHIQSIDCIKIDTEGADFDVLQGCKYILENKIARFIQIEYSEHYKLNNITFTEVVKFVTQYGYAAYTWEFGEYKRITEDNFVENYRLENFIITFELLEDFSQHWNNDFIKNTQGLSKMELIVECGVFEGITTKYMCKHLLKEGGRVICIDPLQDEYLTENLSEQDVMMNKEYGFFKNQYYRFKKNTQGLPIQLIRKTTNEAFHEIEALRIDFAYIDGDHREVPVYEDGINCFNICKEGAIILFDDYLWREETTRGINKFLEWAGDKVEILINGYQLMVRKIKN